MENTEDAKDSTSCFCKDESSNRSRTSSGDFRSTYTDDASELSDLALMRHSGLTVEEIFAQEIHDWRRRYEAQIPLNITVERPSKSKYDGDQSSGSIILNKKRDFNRHALERSLSKSHRTSEDAEGSTNDLLKRYTESKESVSRMGTINLRRAKESISPTGSKEESEKDPDAKHEKRMHAIGPIIRDVIRIFFVIVVSFVLTYLPWIFIEPDQEPNEYKFNITGENICYWLGSTGILDEDNPCPYRSYLHITNKGSDCLTWSEVYDNKTSVDRIKKANHKESKDVLLLLQDFKDRFPEDYKAPFCRRLAKNGSLNNPFCFVYPDNNNEKVPEMQSCWAVPCTKKISNGCYTKKWKLMQRKKKRGDKIDS